MFPFDKRDRTPRSPSLFGEFEDFFREFDVHAAKLLSEAGNSPGKAYVYGYSAYTGADGKPVVDEYTNIPGFKGFYGCEPARPTICGDKREQSGSPVNARHFSVDGVCASNVCRQPPIGGVQDTGPTQPELEGEKAKCDLFHDILDEKDKITVVVDLPGIEKKDIKVQVHGRHLSVSAKGVAREYMGDIELPDFVSSKPQKATYKNGVLEVIYKKETDKTDVKID
ncbi:MAG: Hsp20/alpha crystallin family protein [Candidatus Altiarchaeota archaeon]|nr:Hsp20/alpha crystallin family protein [Candidatus Altiarchaeota archaeon]